MASEYRAQLLAVETKLAKSPDDEELLQLKSDLIELIELAGELDEQPATSSQTADDSGRRGGQKINNSSSPAANASANSRHVDEPATTSSDSRYSATTKRPLTEAELLAKRREKNKKKKAKRSEKIKEQLDTAESVKQSWQSFANKKGLKGLTKKSIFASPCSVTGKVGVGTNGIADAPSIGATNSVSVTKQKY